MPRPAIVAKLNYANSDRFHGKHLQTTDFYEKIKKRNLEFLERNVSFNTAKGSVTNKNPGTNLLSPYLLSFQRIALLITSSMG